MKVGTLSYNPLQDRTMQNCRQFQIVNYVPREKVAHAKLTSVRDPTAAYKSI